MLLFSFETVSECVCVLFFFRTVIVAFDYRSLCTPVIKLYEKYTKELHHTHDGGADFATREQRRRAKEREKSGGKNNRQRKKVVCTKNTEAMTEQKGHEHAACHDK